MRVGAPRGPCSPRFYASYNFESYDIHDDRKGRFYFIVLVGVNAAIYSLKSAAEDALPPRGNFNLIRCRTIREATLQWRKWCTDTHDRTCDLAELANDLPSAVASNDNITPDSEDELLANVPLHKRRYISVIDLPLPSETRNQLRPLIFPIDAATARRLQLTFNGAPLPCAASIGVKCDEAGAKRETKTNTKRKPTAAPSSKCRRALCQVSPPSLKPPLSLKLPLWADEPPPGKQRSPIWIDDTSPAGGSGLTPPESPTCGGPSLTPLESPTRGFSLPARPPKSLPKSLSELVAAGEGTVPMSIPPPTCRITAARRTSTHCQQLPAKSMCTTNHSPGKRTRAQVPPISPSITSALSLSASTPSSISRPAATAPVASTSRVVDDGEIGGGESASTARGRGLCRIPAASASTNRPASTDRPFFYNETKKKIYLSVMWAIAGMAVDDELSVMMSPEEIQVAVNEGSRKGKGVERGGGNVSAGGSEYDVDMTG
ncbi:hypothetical protein K438DRAFT_2021709 [Mycena galopus ATCC 62051]|nr:hypothetical protein K438DRAFT_2021709 [Mycena galopus ATCC 62051]